MAYRGLLMLDPLPKEDYAMLNELVKAYHIPGKTTHAYSTLLSVLLHLACEVQVMQHAIIEDGTTYIARLVGEVVEYTQ